MMSDHIISSFVAFCGSLIPIGLLVWKLAGVVAQVKQNTNDINRIGGKLHETARETDKRLDELNDKLNKIEITIGRIDESLSFIREAIKSRG
jgi:ABC-type transporter Mla subunit MlaD